MALQEAEQLPSQLHQLLNPEQQAGLRTDSCLKEQKEMVEGYTARSTQAHAKMGVIPQLAVENVAGVHKNARECVSWTKSE
jgi:hypothetical protein